MTAVLLQSEFQFWLDAIKSDNAALVQLTLAKCKSREDIEALVNGRFIFTAPLQNKKRVSKEQRILTRPLTLAVAHCARGVLDVLLTNRVDIFVQEDDGSNVLHVLVFAAYHQPDSEEEIAQIYERAFKNRLSLEQLTRLLHTENGEYRKLRPLEMAAERGTFSLMFAFWDTPGIYLARETLVGRDIYRWYDITEYESLDRESGGRYAVSPLRLVGELGLRNFSTPSSRKIFASGLVADWSNRARRTNRPLQQTWMLARILYVIVFALFDADAYWLHKIGGISSAASGDDVTKREGALLPRRNDSFVYCSGAAPYVLSPSARLLFTVYLVLQSIVVLLYDIYSVVEKRKNLSAVFAHDLKTDLMEARGRYVNSNFALFVLIQTVVLYCATERGNWTTASDLIRLWMLTTMLGATKQYMQIIPKVGHVFVYIRRTTEDFMTFGWIIFDVTVVFSRAAMINVNVNSNQGCVEAFSNLAYSMYTTFLTMLNMVDYKQYSVVSVDLLYTQQFMYVFVVGILMYNMLIAMSNDSIEKVYRDKELVIKVGRNRALTELNINLGRIPAVRGATYSRFYEWQMQQQFVTSGGRVYLVAIKHNAKTNKKLK